MYFKVSFCKHYHVIYLNSRSVRAKSSAYFGRGTGPILMNSFLVAEMRGLWHCVHSKDLVGENVITARMLGSCVNENVNVYINCFPLT